MIGAERQLYMLIEWLNNIANEDDIEGVFKYVFPSELDEEDEELKIDWTRFKVIPEKEILPTDSFSILINDLVYETLANDCDLDTRWDALKAIQYLYDVVL